MKYKILLSIPNTYNGSVYYKYYQVSPAEGDWYTTDKSEAITKIEELLQTYGETEISVVIELDITNNIDIPDLPSGVESTAVATELNETK